MSPQIAFAISVVLGFVAWGVVAWRSSLCSRWRACGALERDSWTT
jgi:hypothetical protein